MARHYFDISAPSPIADPVGMNLENISQVKHEALRRAAEFASGVGNLEKLGAIVVAVRGEAGDPVMTVRLMCQVETPGQSPAAFAPLC